MPSSLLDREDTKMSKIPPFQILAVWGMVVMETIMVKVQMVKILHTGSQPS